MIHGEMVYILRESVDLRLGSNDGVINGRKMGVSLGDKWVTIVASAR